MAIQQNEAISSKIMPRADNPLLDVLDTALQKLQLNAAGIKDVVLTVAVVAGTPNVGDTIQVRYNLTGQKVAGFDFDFGAVITGNLAPVERSFSDSNGMGLAIQFVEVELTALVSGDAVYQVAVNGTRRGGVG